MPDQNQNTPGRGFEGPAAPPAMGLSLADLPMLANPLLAPARPEDKVFATRFETLAGVVKDPAGLGRFCALVNFYLSKVPDDPVEDPQV